MPAHVCERAVGIEAEPGLMGGFGRLELVHVGGTAAQLLTRGVRPRRPHFVFLLVETSNLRIHHNREAFRFT